MWIENFILLLLAQFSPHEPPLSPLERQYVLVPRVEWQILPHKSQLPPSERQYAMEPRVEWRIRRNKEDYDDNRRNRLSNIQKARLHRVEVRVKTRYNRRGCRQSYKN